MNLKGNNSNTKPKLSIAGAYSALPAAILAVATYSHLAANVWARDDQGHAPIILAVTLWLAWNKRDEFKAIPNCEQNKAAPHIALIIILTIYAIAKSQSIDAIEAALLIPAIGIQVFIYKGLPGLRIAAPLLFFLIFLIPLPASIVQAITTPLKILVSAAAQVVLENTPYPIAREGVVLYVGQYQMLVADACAGLHSIFTLEALGLLYANMMKHSSLARNIALAILTIPTAFLANVLRVIAIVLITMEFGDEVGQGFVHGFAGMFLFLVALLALITVDQLAFEKIFSNSNHE